MHDFSSMSLKPFKIEPTRVWRTYTGGKLIDTWRNFSDPKDSQFPEEWVASVTAARNPGREHIENEGLSLVQLDNQHKIPLKQLIESDPEGFLGSRHVKRFGIHTGVLVKLLDSAERLTIQVHPDRKKAMDLFNSPFGKTEAWYIIGGRTILGQPPYILLGFKPGITEKQWKILFREQDVNGMINSLNKFEIQPGQIFLIEGGVPHAIGPGCFLVEIQEPTDYTIRVERTTPTGREISDSLCHQGLGFERMFDCFHYEGYSKDKALNRWSIQPRVLTHNSSCKEETLITYENTPHFAMNSLEIYNHVDLDSTPAFSILIVISGSGCLHFGDKQMLIQQGDEIFLPARLKNLGISIINGEPLKVIRCFPPLL